MRSELRREPLKKDPELFEDASRQIREDLPLRNAELFREVCEKNHLDWTSLARFATMNIDVIGQHRLAQVYDREDATAFVQHLTDAADVIIEVLREGSLNSGRPIDGATGQLLERAIDACLDEWAAKASIGVHRADSGLQDDSSGRKTRDRPKRLQPDTARRRAIVSQYPNLNAAQLCREFDDEGIPAVSGWKHETWVQAYKDAQLRPRIQTIVSKDRRRLRAEA